MATTTPTAGIAEYATTTGTGAYALRGALPGYASVVSRIFDRREVKYRATNGVTQEVGRGLYDAATNTLGRNYIEQPTSGVPVDWGAGRKLIYIIEE